jgi:4-amino-4-deoxy-L-arabinose transferase-like glycosyltransferase
VATAAAGLGAEAWRRRWLSLQVGTGLVLQLALRSPW